MKQCSLATLLVQASLVEPQRLLERESAMRLCGLQEAVEQLAECLKQHGDQIDTPANMWLNDLVHAYVSISFSASCQQGDLALKRSSPTLDADPKAGM